MRRSFLRRFGVCAGVLLGLVVSMRAARAVDLVELKDGRVLFGWVVEQSEKEVKFETTIANVKSVMTFKRKEIVRLELDPIRPGTEPEAFDAEDGVEDPGDAPAAPANTGVFSPRRRYVLVPIEGTFGEQVFAEGVREALRSAVSAGVQDVVFHIRSGGGAVVEARAIAAAMKEFDEKLYYHAIVEEAYSACIWVLSLCDTIFLRPDAATGAAVAFRVNVDTGAVEVDAKFLSALAAEVGAQAESKGKPGAIFKAMIIPELELWTWRDASGRARFDNAPPPDSAADRRRLDGPATVYSLTGADAVALGFAAFLDAKTNIGVALDGKEWDLDSEVGRQAMQRAVLKRERAAAANDRLANEIIATIDEAVLAIAEAERAHPRAVQSYFYDPTTGFLTPQSQADWRNNSRKAISLWTKVQGKLRELDGLLNRFAQVHGRKLPIEFEVESALRRADAEIKALRENQNRSRP